MEAVFVQKKERILIEAGVELLVSAEILFELDRTVIL